MYKLSREQKKLKNALVEQAVKGKRVHFYESSTGTGKTAAMFHAALEIADKLQKPVIIATNNNKLVAQYTRGGGDLDNFEALRKNRDRFVSVLGMENYVAPTRMELYLDDLEKDIAPDDPKANYMKSFIVRCREWLEKCKRGEENGLFANLESYLVDNFRMVEYDDDLKDRICLKYRMPIEAIIKDESVVENLDSKTISDYLEAEKIFYNRAVKEISGNKIIITNHHLVLMGYFWDKQSVLPEDVACIMFDEAHTIDQAANLLLSVSFAPGYLMARCRYILHNKNDWKNMRGAGELAKQLKKILSVLDEIEKYKNENMAGESVNLLDEDNINVRNKHYAWIKDIKEVAMGTKNTSLRGRLTKLSEHTKSADLKKHIKAAIVELDELYKIENMLKVENYRKVSGIFVSYSQKKGLPSYRGIKDSGRIKLYKKFWTNEKKGASIPIAMLSGSFQLFKGDAHILTVVGLSISKETKNKIFELNNDEVWYSYIRTKKRKQDYMGVEIIEKERTLRPPIMAGKNGKTKEEYEEERKQWINDLAREIKKIYEKRPYKTLVLLGSYRDATDLGERLRDEYRWLTEGESRMLWYCNKDISTNAQVRQFNMSKSGVFIGMKVLWTGYDIADIKNLIMAKLPYPSPEELPRLIRSKRISEMYNSTWEMCMTYKQGAGRLVRWMPDVLPNPLPMLYILDSRIYNVDQKPLSLIKPIKSVDDMLKIAYGQQLRA